MPIQKRTSKEVFGIIHQEMFPGLERNEESLAILSKFNEAFEAEEHKFHVWICVLKLAGSDLLKMAKYVDLANRDWRDILYWAETPNSARFGFTDDPKIRKKLAKEDAEQYKEWRNSFLIPK